MGPRPIPKQQVELQMYSNGILPLDARCVYSLTDNNVYSEKEIYAYNIEMDYCCVAIDCGG